MLYQRRKGSSASGWVCQNSLNLRNVITCISETGESNTSDQDSKRFGAPKTESVLVMAASGTYSPGHRGRALKSKTFSHHGWRPEASGLTRGYSLLPLRGCFKDALRAVE